MDQSHPTWGVVTTVKTTRDVLEKFIAYHLDLGADHIWVFFDDPNLVCPQSFQHLPQVSTIICDQTYYQSHGRTGAERLELRQSFNAQLIRRTCALDWLCHIDVDEFVVTDGNVGAYLAAIAPSEIALRLNPSEVLSTPANAPLPAGQYYCKSPVPKGRDDLAEDIYGEYGAVVPQGFLSHRIGKLFLRTSTKNIIHRIHNIYHRRPGQEPQIIDDLPSNSTLRLVHMHAPNWQAWRGHLDWRHADGAYRADLDHAGNQLNAVLNLLKAEAGEAGLRAFYDAMHLATPTLLSNLANADLLRVETLDLDQKQARYFPNSP